jgi:hypothetical protein
VAQPIFWSEGGFFGPLFVVATWQSLTDNVRFHFSNTSYDGFLDLTKAKSLALSINSQFLASQDIADDGESVDIWRCQPPLI